MRISDWSSDVCSSDLVFLAGVAGATEQIGLASSINILPLQHAVVQAKAWSTLDWLSGGRATAVVAVGWLKEEFDLLDVPFHERGAMTDDYVQAMLALWKIGRSSCWERGLQ